MIPDRAKALTDLDVMPFGEHGGRQMCEVPAQWLNGYFWEAQGNPLCPVLGYIRNNLHALKQEKPDLLWE